MVRNIKIRNFLNIWGVVRHKAKKDNTDKPRRMWGFEMNAKKWECKAVSLHPKGCTCDIRIAALERLISDFIVSAMISDVLAEMGLHRAIFSKSMWWKRKRK